MYDRNVIKLATVRLCLHLMNITISVVPSFSEIVCGIYLYANLGLLQTHVKFIRVVNKTLLALSLRTANQYFGLCKYQ
jgi:hypothetical protein